MGTAGAGSGADVVLDGSSAVRACGCEAAEGIRGNGGSGGGLSVTRYVRYCAGAETMAGESLADSESRPGALRPFR